MRDLNYQLKNLCEHNKDGSHNTQVNRHQLLQTMANHLFELGYRRMNANSLKPKHVDALIARYLNEGLAEGTIKNRLSALRWWAEKVGKPNIIAKDNAHYGVESRVFVTNVSKARDLDRELLNKITCDHVRMSLELQKAFGLRREEAIKFIPEYADQGNHIRLKATWCKGGRERTIPIRNEEQREVLNRARLLAGRGSLIPSHLMYVDQMRIYEAETNKVGLHKMHGMLSLVLMVFSWLASCAFFLSSEMRLIKETQQRSPEYVSLQQEIDGLQKNIAIEEQLLNKRLGSSYHQQWEQAQNSAARIEKFHVEIAAKQSALSQVGLSSSVNQLENTKLFAAISHTLNIGLDTARTAGYAVLALLLEVSTLGMISLAGAEREVDSLLFPRPDEPELSPDDDTAIDEAYRQKLAQLTIDILQGKTRPVLRVIKSANSEKNRSLNLSLNCFGFFVKNFVEIRFPPERLVS